MNIPLLKLLKIYLLTVPVVVILDLLWLGVIARNFYQKQLAHLLSAEINWPAAIIFYFLYTAGLIVFAAAPAIERSSIMRALACGAFVGLFAYGTYDLTNQATLRGWPVAVTCIDMLWGCVISAATAACAYGMSKIMS